MKQRRRPGRERAELLTLLSKQCVKNCWGLETRFGSNSRLLQKPKIEPLLFPGISSGGQSDGFAEAPQRCSAARHLLASGADDCARAHAPGRVAGSVQELPRVPDITVDPWNLYEQIILKSDPTKSKQLVSSSGLLKLPTGCPTWKRRSKLQRIHLKS